MSDLKGEWALILGSSSGFGEAVSLELARRGMNVAGVHLDRKATQPNAERIVSEIKAMGREAIRSETPCIAAKPSTSRNGS